MGEPTSDLSEKLLQSIPTLFYDALARVCPGGAFLYFLAKQGPLISSVTTPDLIMFVVGGYITGVLLTAISSMIFDGPLELLSRLSVRLQRLSPNRLWDQIDALDAHNERHAKLLIKIDAEMTSCQNLFVGFVALVTLQSAGYLINESLLFDLRKPIAWVIGTAILVAVVHRTLILYRRVRVLARTAPSLHTN
ncbi:MAG TPA: hypothetical protein VKG86_00510 [Terracidiphilus sp.]|nr:hypothetical protein [Terracidiphilus sp.]